MNYLENSSSEWEKGRVKTSDGRVVITWDITGDKPKEISRGSFGRFSRRDDLWLPPVAYRDMYRQVCALSLKLKNERKKNLPLPPSPTLF